jgi:hypothetical protein
LIIPAGITFPGKHPVPAVAEFVAQLLADALGILMCINVDAFCVVVIWL